MPAEAEGFVSLELYLFHAWTALAAAGTWVNLCIQKTGLVDIKLAFIYWNSFWLLFLFVPRKPCWWQVGAKIAVFLIPASLTYSLIWKIKRDTYSLAKRWGFLKKFGLLFIITIFIPWNNAVFDSYFTEENETLGRIYWSLEGNSCKQINTTQACLLYILFLFLCSLLIDLPQGRDSSDSDTKQVLKENISFKKGAEERAAVAKNC